MSRNPYVRPMPKASWYLGSARYRLYMLREITCLLVGFYAFLMIWALAALSANSPERWDAFLATQHNIGMVVVHAFALVYYLVFMTLDWFKLAPKAMPIQLGEKRVSDRAIALGHYVVWAVFTLFVFWLAGVF
jgi:succinate dehydrogenase subunit C